MSGSHTYMRCLSASEADINTCLSTKGGALFNRASFQRTAAGTVAWCNVCGRNAPCSVKKYRTLNTVGGRVFSVASKSGYVSTGMRVWHAASEVVAFFFSPLPLASRLGDFPNAVVHPYAAGKEPPQM